MQGNSYKIPNNTLLLNPKVNHFQECEQENCFSFDAIERNSFYLHPIEFWIHIHQAIAQVLRAVSMYYKTY